MNKQKPPIDLSEYHTLGLPLLGLMGLVALAGVLLEVVFYYFF
jgi:hypothetical protein